MKSKIGIIGGSGLDNPDLLQDYKEVEIETPFGKPSDKITTGKINDVEVFILARHGKKHQYSPSGINYKANIYALAKLGCKYIIATSAVGSLREDIKPGDFVIPNQLIDFTKQRKNTFYDSFEKEIKHESLAEPFSSELREKLIENCLELNFGVHKKATLITIQGPRFSTKAESNLFRQWNCDIIGMTTATEASLAREAGLEYACVSMSTDYDCWKQGEEDVSMEMVLKTMEQNAEKVKKLILKTIEKFSLKEKVQKDILEIKESIRTIPDFPKPGIQFRDITTLMKDPQAFKKTVEILYNRYKEREIDVVAGIESRGFIFGAILAEKLNSRFIPVRKPGKLPSEIERQEYELEYGSDAVEIHKDAIQKGDKVLIIDDLIATGGTARATCDLIEKLGGKIEECGFVIELPELKGREKLNKWNVFSIVKFEGE